MFGDIFHKLRYVFVLFNAKYVFFKPGSETAVSFMYSSLQLTKVEFLYTVLIVYVSLNAIL